MAADRTGAHGRRHDHGHDHAHGLTGRTLRTAFVLTLVILAVELAGGLLSHSLALLSDAGHVLTDIFALGLAWFAAAQAGRPADARNTYGYHRIGILTALVNAVTLILVVMWIAYEAVGRFQHPQEVTPWLMFVSAAVGIAVNLYIAVGLQKGGAENLNARAALLHVLGDIGASAGVIVGGVVILLTRWSPVDPLISLGIAVLIARGTWSVLRETVDILMEATPKDVNVAGLVRDMLRAPSVVDVHDLHVWSIAGGMRALSAHVQVGDRPLSACGPVLDDLRGLLRDKYRIAHSTIQFECADCAGARELYCGDLTTTAAHSHAHDGHAHDDHAHTPDGLDVAVPRREASGGRRG